MKNKRVRLRRILRERISEEEQQATDKPINVGISHQRQINYPLSMVKMTQKVYDCDFRAAKKILLDKHIESIIRYEFKKLSNE